MTAAWEHSEQKQHTVRIAVSLAAAALLSNAQPSGGGKTHWAQCKYEPTLPSDKSCGILQPLWVRALRPNMSFALTTADWQEPN